MKDLQFPEGFHWGAATASYQVEGGIENNDWAQAAREGRVPECGRACDHYNRYEQDFDLAVSLGHTAHRFSIEWARIEPEEGKWNMREVEHYKAVLRALRARNLEPYVTLWHFTLPQWFADKGGFEHPDAPQIFARYAAFIVSELQELAVNFATMNEPNVYATHGYLYGVWCPFKQARIGWKILGDGEHTTPQFSNLFTYLKVSRQLAQSHIEAYKAIKKVAPASMVSFVKQIHVYGHNWNPINWVKYKMSTYFQNHRFLKRVHQHLDQIGLNYYHCDIFGQPWTGKRTDMYWNFRPERIYDALKLLQAYQKPIYVSEAGLADEDDSDRSEYISKQIEGVWHALQEGVDVRGHMYWSLMDNYEWAEGFGKRFGLVDINYQTLERKPRPSAYVYKEIIEQNGILEYTSE